jgi:hypothetical protein
MNTPRKIEWAAPEGWSVWADEYGVHLRSRSGDAMEMPDVDRLFRLWSEACAAVSPGGQIPAPKPPSRDEIRHMGTERVEEYVRRRAVRAIESEFAATDIAPF